MAKHEAPHAHFDGIELKDRLMAAHRPKGRHRAYVSSVELAAEWTNPDPQFIETRRRVNTQMPHVGKLLTQFARSGY